MSIPFDFSLFPYSNFNDVNLDYLLTIYNEYKEQLDSGALVGPQGPQGTPGIDGVSPTISIGSVTTLDAGDNATVTNGGTSENVILNFGIPKGADGTVSPDNIALAFSNTKNYSANDYVYYNGQLYRFLVDHSSGAWNPNEVIDVPVAPEISNITSYSKNLAVLRWAQARISPTGDFNTTSALGNCAEAEYIPVDGNTDYTISGGEPGTAFTLYYNEYKSDYTFIKRTSYQFNSTSCKGVTFTTDANTAYVRFYGYKSGIDPFTMFPTEFQIEKGSKATRYVAPIVVDTNKLDAPKAKEYLGINSNTLLCGIGINLFRTQLFYDHVFIDKVNGVNVIIPNQSVFNIETAKRLGFNMIEGNINKSSDGVPYVFHGLNGKFGGMFGPTVEDTLVNSVTSAWIQSNVRYVSNYTKYRVCPPTLEEWLTECKRLCMIPFVQAYTDDIIEVCDKIVGKNNYIAYGSKRSMTDGYISHYLSLTTKQEIIDHCNEVGAPFIYSMANPTAFTDVELRDIVDTVHENGYLISCAASYLSESETQRLIGMGFDIAASKYQVNPFENGNLCNLHADVDFSDFSTTGTVTDYVLNLAANDTISLNSTLPSVFLGKAYLMIRYNGSLKITMGNYLNEIITSDASKAMEFSSYFMEASPSFTIEAQGATEVYSIEFKASEC